MLAFLFAEGNPAVVFVWYRGFVCKKLNCGVCLGNRGDNRGDNMFLGLPEEQRRICEMLIANPRMSVRGIAAALNVRPRTVEKQIAALKVKNVVVREGGTRGYWRVIFGAV